MKHWKLVPFAAGSFPAFVSFNVKYRPTMSSVPDNFDLTSSHVTRCLPSISEAGNKQDPNENRTSTQKPVPKVHTLTVCMVPPPSNVEVWNTVYQMRELLRDPGLFRWPPHVNLLYPFVNFEAIEGHDATSTPLFETVQLIRQATKQIEPFPVCLNAYGTFGGRNRGVLWLNPDSRKGAVGDESDNSTIPLMDLHSSLEKAFPMCLDLSQKGNTGKFSPHMTLSHFKNLTDALDAQTKLEEKFSLNELSFVMDRVYLLKRQGDGGHFHRLAEVFLGQTEEANKEEYQIYEPPLPFPSMPLFEADWVYQERMALKKRRNWSGNRRGGKRYRRRRSDEPRVPDTPEEIERKRAERKLKRERLA